MPVYSASSSGGSSSGSGSSARAFVGPGDMSPTFGTVSDGDLNTAAARLFGDAAANTAGFQFDLTDHGWATYKATAYWGKATTNSGDIRLRGDHGAITVGSTPTRTLGAEQVVTAPAVQYEITTTELFSGISVPASGIIIVSFSRIGSAGTDTLGGNVGLVGILLEKVS